MPRSLDSVAALVIVACALGACTRIPPASDDGGGPGCSCAGRECGTDGCGNSCGSCTGGMECNASGRCVTACIPDCRDRDCGPDPVCGMSCGPTSCDDGNPCTADGCSSGRCSHTNTDGALACVDDLTVSACLSGSITQLSCGRVAREIGEMNATYGCTDGRCVTTSFPDRPTCTEHDRVCATSGGVGHLGFCLRDETGATYWYFKTCAAVCEDDSRFTAWTGECGPAPDGQESCFCR